MELLASAGVVRLADGLLALGRSEPSDLCLVIVLTPA
jgi:hypothetical protein